jgi:hypothetical protein
MRGRLRPFAYALRHSHLSGSTSLDSVDAVDLVDAVDV